MKRFSILSILLLMLLCGCSQNQSSSVLNNPYEISTNDGVLSYYGEKSDFESAGFDSFSKALESSMSKKNNVFANKEGIVRNIVITDRDIVTYRNISVGDSVDKIENAFAHEVNLNTSYSVLFDGVTEINPKNSSPIQDDFIWINYTTNGKTIEKITIYDVLYGKEMK